MRNFAVRLQHFDAIRLRTVAVLVLAAALFHACAFAAGNNDLMPAIIVAVAVLFVLLRQDGVTSALFLGALGFDWYGVPQHASWWCVPAGLMMLCAHSALTLHASSPENSPLPSPVVSRWIKRTALVAAFCAPFSALLVLLRQEQISGVWWIVPVALAVFSALLLGIARDIWTGDS